MNDDPSKILAPVEPIQQTPDAEIVRADNWPAAAMPGASQLTGILLPQEHLMFGSRPHWIVFVRPTINAFIAIVVLSVAVSVRLHPILRGHHVNLPLYSTPTGVLITFGAALFLLGGIRQIIRAAIYYTGYRVVATNRRVFVIDGLLGRRVRPIGNTAMAASRLVQGFLGRRWDFGSIVTGIGSIRDMREPVALYRSLQAVANGVEGDTWKPPIRNTVIP